MNSNPIELLAPAGSPEALAAAIANGADAVYMGGSQFSARAFAANFDDAAMERAIRLAHLYGVNVYVTVNTLLDPHELEQAIIYLKMLYEWGADAVIVQDLGLMRAARELIPGLPLHASTQMTIHNEWGVQFLRDAGVERVVLAREVSLAEIRAIGQKVSLPLEVFVHGALCFSYSGQCLLSSLIGGRSGNRGRCAQPCRLEYALLDPEGHAISAPGSHLLSPSDLNMLAALPELRESGVAALKIEGRMKRPEYVATVVRVYRTALDRVMQDPAGFVATREELRDLEQIFNRGFTTGYFFERPGAALMSYQRPNNRGLLLGRVARAPGDRYSIRLEQPLRSGDGIEVWVTRGGRAGTEVGEMKVQGKTVSEAQAGAIVELPLPGRPASGDRVFKTGDSRLLSVAKESFSAAGPARPIPVHMHFRAYAGAPAELWIDDEEGHSAHVTGSFVVEPARKHPLSAEKAREQLTRLGGTVFSETSFDAKLDGEIMIPVSELNNMRREAVDLLEKSRLAAWTRSPLPAGFDEKVASLSVNSAPPSNTGAGLSVAVADLESLKAALSAGPDRVYFGGESYRPRGRWTSEQMRIGIRDCREAGARAIVSLPRIVAERETQKLQEWTREIAVMRPDGFLIRNPGQIEMLRTVWQGPILADYPINVFNHKALETLGRLEMVTLSPELTLVQVDKVASLIRGRHPGMTVEVLVHGAITLMVSEHCPLGALAGGGAGEQAGGCSMPCRTPGAGLRDRLGLIFPIRTDASCRMHLFNSMDLNMLADAPELAAMGLSVRVEGLAHAPRYVAEAVRYYRARLKGRLSGPELTGAQEDLQRFSPQGFTRGHYFRGV